MKSALLAARLAVIVAIGAAVSLGCGGGETFVPTGGGGDTTSTAPGGGGTHTGATSTGGTTTQGGGGTSTGGTTTGGTAGTGGTTTTDTGECSVPADCDTSQGGPPACGTWACNNGVCFASSPNCVDADSDGYGFGPMCACAGLDCDDNDAMVGSDTVGKCYSGPAGTDGVGTCHSGTATCTAGVWSPCSGEVIPGGEACNNQDDDCNGMVDDNLGMFSCGLGACAASVSACAGGLAGVCKAGSPAVGDDANCAAGGVGNGIDDDCDGAIDEDCGCIAVYAASASPTEDGSFLNPFKTIQAAINFAVANPMGPQTVCVAGGVACASGPYNPGMGNTITMANGVSVIGSYNPAAIPWVRCQNISVTIQPQTAAGVTFPATVVKTTVLDGVRVDRFTATTTAAITVDGAKNVILTNIAITNAPPVASSYGVNIINGADATVTKSRIDAGTGTTESIAVRVDGSKASIVNNCSAALDPVTGRCTGFASQNNSLPALLGQGTGIGTTYAVLLQNSPGSKIETSSLGRMNTDFGAIIRITGDGAGTQVRANTVEAWSGLLEAVGISLDDCADAAPWIVDNQWIGAQGDNANTVVRAIQALGACHPVIDSNNTIIGGAEGQAHNPIAVYCGMNQQGVTSKCSVLGNAAIRGSAACYPPTAVGVKCDDGGCNRIANNRLITGRGAAMESIGVWLGSTGTTVENNVIQGGCAGGGGMMGTSIGVRMDDSYARLENNRIFGYVQSDCNCGAGNVGAVATTYGVRVLLKPGNHDVDIHSNDIDGGGPVPGGFNSCSSRGLTVDLAPGIVSAQNGIFRNNIIRAGTSCMVSRICFSEPLAGGDPLIVENNDFDPAGMPHALYLDEGFTNLTMPSDIDLLADITVAGSISADPLFASYPMDVHISAGSPCVGKGTPVGAPLFDFEGTPRDAFTPDIGADEN